MKSAYTFPTKILAMFLSILLVFYVLPISAVAEEINNASSASQSNTSEGEGSTNNNYTTHTPYTYYNEVYEETSLREESVKHFRLEDGSYIAAAYSAPVHYLDNNEWQDINNTLTESETELVTNDARVKFIKKTTGNGNIFTLHDGNTKITLGLVGANKKINAVATNNEETETTALGKLMNLEGLTSRIRYNEILDGVDIEYVLDSLNIKENIIIKEKKDAYTYTFTLSLNGLEAELLANGDISITKSGEQKYKIPAPVVFDSADNTAPVSAAGYTLTDNGNGKYTLTVSVSSEWMNSADRVYPVTLDPAIVHGVGSIVTDTYGKYGPNATPTEFHGFSNLNVSSDEMTVIKLNSIPSIPTGARLSKATISLTRLDGLGDYVGAYFINNDWTPYIESFNANDVELGDIIDYCNTTVEYDEDYDDPRTFVWDISTAVKAWYNGTANNGIAFKNINEEISYSTTFASSLGGAYDQQPKFKIYYVNTLGVEDYYSYSTQSGGAAGTGYVNHATGDLTFSIGTLASTDYLMPVTPSLVYNSALANKSYTSANVNTAYATSNMAKGFKLNLTETLVKRTYAKLNGTETYYIWADGDGTEHFFYSTDTENIYRDDSGRLLILDVTSSTNPTITDINKNVRRFTSCDSNVDCWRLSQIFDKVGNELRITYNTSGWATAISLCPNGNNSNIAMLSLQYSYGRLYKITNVASNHSVTFKYSNTYNGDISTSATAYLRQIEYSHVEQNATGANVTVTDATMYYEYDANGYLLSAKNGLANYTVNYEWTNGKVSSVYEKGGTTQGVKLGFTYGEGYTEVTMPKGNEVYSNYSSAIINRYKYDQYFRVVSSYSTDTNRSIIYGAANGTYETQENIKNNIKETITTGGNPTNYLLNGDFSLITNSGIAYWSRSHSTIIQTASSDADLEQSQDELNDFPRIKIPYTSGTYYISQKAYLPVGQYTFSFDINTKNAKNLIVESVTRRQSLTSENAKSVNVNEVLESKSRYKHKMSLNVSVADVYELKIRVTSIGAVATNATVYIDNVQLERSVDASEYSFVSVGNFDDNYRDANGADPSSVSQSTFWNATAGTSFVTDGSEAFGTVAKVEGDIDDSRYLRQTVYRSPARGPQYYPNDNRVFIVSGFAKAPQGAFSNNLAKFALKVDIYYSHLDGSETARTQYIDFDKDCTDWQYVSAIINTKYENPPNDDYDYVSKIEISCDFSYQNGGVAYFDNICFIDAGQKRTEYLYNATGLLSTIKGAFNSEYREYEETNLVRVANNSGEIWDYSYNANDTLASEVYYTFLYKNVSKDYPYGVDDPDSVIVKTPVTKTVYSYNAYGQMLRSESYPAVASGSDVVKKSGSASVLTVNTYETTAGSAIFGALTKTSNGAGNTIKYFYDTSKGYLLAEVNVEDKVGTAYTYDAIGNLISAKPATYNTTTGAYSTVNNAESVTYQYNSKNELARITTGSTTYNFTYDSFGRMSGFMGDDIEYGYTLDGKVRYVRYTSTDGNGIISHSYEYDVLGRVISESYNESFYDEGSGEVYYDTVLLYEYEYTSDGKLHRVYDVWNGEYILYDYDALGRLRQIVKSNDEDASYYDTPTDVYNDFSIYYTYDDLADPSRLRFTKYGFSYLSGTSLTSSDIEIEYSYNSNGSLKSTEITSDSEYVAGVTYDYDDFLRLKGKTVTNDETPDDNQSTGTPHYTNDITYEYNVETAANGSLVETGEVKKYTSKVGNTTNVYTYTYDGRGNIKTVSLDNVLQYEYYYDDLGQLYYVVDYVQGLYICYYYDNAGNLYERYVEGINDDTLYYDEFTYASSPYGDRLISYNGESITYDEYGRTSSYRGKNISYFGYSARNISHFGNAYFTYYEDGMRRTKTVGGVTHYYTYDGINLIKEEWGDNILVFLYDADGSPIGMQYRTTSYDEGKWDTYYYEKNLQGDIVAIYNVSGVKLVTYTYDAWGNFTRTDVASSVPDIVKNNPITYRGYYYDDDLDLYYLATRYYDPETCRFVTADDYAVLTATPMGLTDKNLYAYCDNNPIMRVDNGGAFWDTVFDVISLGSSIVEVCINPYDVWTWIGLVGDAADLIPFVTGVGEITRGVKIATGAAEVLDTAGDIAKVGKKAPIVIGENMKRVKKYAEEIGGHAYRPWKNTPFDYNTAMRRNERWISDMMDEGREIIDIGPDFARRRAGVAPSDFYNMERSRVKGYPNYRRVFTRQGIYGGLQGEW